MPVVHFSTTTVISEEIKVLIESNLLANLTVYRSAGNRIFDGCIRS